jgi:Transposase IS200 like
LNKPFALSILAVSTTAIVLSELGKNASHSVLMPEHVHLLLTPSQNTTLEHAIQLIKGGYSHALGTVPGKRETWQRGFTDHQIRDGQDFRNHLNYIHQNPVARKIVNDPREYRYCSAFPGFKLDLWPSGAEAASTNLTSTRTSGTRALPGFF